MHVLFSGDSLVRIPHETTLTHSRSRLPQSYLPSVCLWLGMTPCTAPGYYNKSTSACTNFFSSSLLFFVSWCHQAQSSIRVSISSEPICLPGSASLQSRSLLHCSCFVCSLHCDHFALCLIAESWILYSTDPFIYHQSLLNRRIEACLVAAASGDCLTAITPSIFGILFSTDPFN